MKANIFVRKNGNKGLIASILPDALASAFYNVFTDRSDKNASIRDAGALGKVWDKIEAKFGDVEKIVIDDFKTPRETRIKDGKKIISEMHEYDGRTTILNLNVTAMLANIGNDLASADGRITKQTRNLLKLAVSNEAIGFVAGKRGRNQKALQSQDQQADALLDALK